MYSDIELNYDEFKTDKKTVKPLFEMEVLATAHLRYTHVSQCSTFLVWRRFCRAIDG
jgi:hypothetical protein